MIEVLLVQFLVLAFTGVVWWLARRDLASRAAPPVPADMQADARELEQLCATLEALVTDLAGRMGAVEQRLQENIGPPLAAHSPAPAPAPMPSLGASPLLPMPPAPPTTPVPMEMASGDAARLSFPALFREPPAPESEVAAHAPLYALLEAGVTDPAEITRRTGLGRGEVDLILSLRARRAL